MHTNDMLKCERLLFLSGGISVDFFVFYFSLYIGLWFSIFFPSKFFFYKQKEKQNILKVMYHRWKKKHRTTGGIQNNAKDL